MHPSSSKTSANWAWNSDATEHLFDPAMEALIQFRNPESKWLRGMVHLPSKAGARRPVPGVVFFHGFTGDRMESHWIFIKCARALAQSGIASLRFDFFGSGESEGEFHEATLQTELADARAAVEFFSEQNGIDGKCLGLCGLSLGGTVAACTAGDVRARALVLWSAVAYPSLLQALASAQATPVATKYGMVEYDAREISSAFLSTAPQVTPLQSILRFKRPTLIIHPGQDETVPLSHAEDYYKTSAAKTKELAVIQGADHTFTSVAWEHEVIERTVGWFRQHLA